MRFPLKGEVRAPLAAVQAAPASPEAEPGWPHGLVATGDVGVLLPRRRQTLRRPTSGPCLPLRSKPEPRGGNVPALALVPRSPDSGPRSLTFPSVTGSSVSQARWPPGSCSLRAKGKEGETHQPGCPPPDNPIPGRDNCPGLLTLAAAQTSY